MNKRFVHMSLVVAALAQQALAEDPEKNSGKLEIITPRVKVSESTTGRRPNQNQDARPAERAQRNEKRSADEDAIRATAEAYAAAFSSGDAKAAARQYTENAEYIDAQGIHYDGRRSIEDLLTAFFANSPERKMDVVIDSLRFITPTIAIEDGVTTITPAKDASPIVCQYTAIHTKNNGQWQTASVRERFPTQPRQHRSQLQQMEWLIGDWVHEGDDAIVRFSCKAVDEGNFLVRKFTVHVAGQQTMTGTQRIGWDPQASKFRTWIFDSDGGYAEGYWHRDESGWNLKLTGVTPDGASASSTSIYQFVDAKTMTFRTVDHEVGGIEFPDSQPVTIVRQFDNSEKTTQHDSE